MTGKDLRHKKVTRNVIWLILALIAVAVFMYIFLEETCTFNLERIIEVKPPATEQNIPDEVFPAPEDEEEVDDQENIKDEQIEVNRKVNWERDGFV